MQLFSNIFSNSSTTADGGRFSEPLQEPKMKPNRKPVKKKFSFTCGETDNFHANEANRKKPDQKLGSAQSITMHQPPMVMHQPSMMMYGSQPCYMPIHAPCNQPLPNQLAPTPNYGQCSVQDHQHIQRKSPCGLTSNSSSWTSPIKMFPGQRSRVGLPPDCSPSRNMTTHKPQLSYADCHYLPPICGLSGRDLRINFDLASLPLQDFGTIIVRYFDVRRFLGRGGKIRFLLRANHVKHVYESFDISKSSTDSIYLFQQHLIATGGSPTGHLPVLQHEEYILCETVAILRYLAKQLGDYGRNHHNDYLYDMCMDKLAYWSDDLMSAISEANAGMISVGVCSYVKLRNGYYTLFERLLNLLADSVAPINCYPARLNNNSKDLVKPNYEWEYRIRHLCNWCNCSIAATVLDDIQLIALVKKLHRIRQWENIEGRDGFQKNKYIEDLEYLLQDEQPLDQLKTSPRLNILLKDLCDLPLIKEMLAEKEAIRLFEDSSPYLFEQENKNTKYNTTSQSLKTSSRKEAISADLMDQNLSFTQQTTTASDQEGKDSEQPGKNTKDHVNQSKMDNSALEPLPENQSRPQVETT